MRAPVEHASVAAGFGGSCDWPLTFRPSRDQCLYELVALCAETTRRARGAFSRGGTNGSNLSPSRKESANHRLLSGKAASGVYPNRSGRFTKSKVLYRRAIGRFTRSISSLC
jgi:hypothetical protein